MSTSLLLLMIKLAMVGGGGTFADSVLSSKVLKPLGYARHAVGRSSVILQASPSIFCITLNVNSSPSVFCINLNVNFITTAGKWHLGSHTAAVTPIHRLERNKVSFEKSSHLGF